MSDLVDKTILKTFVPPSALNAENFQELAGKTFVEDIAAGKAIFTTPPPSPRSSD